jgi:translation initiation factor IF-1
MKLSEIKSAAPFKLYIANAYGAGYDDKPCHKGEHLYTEDGDDVVFVKVADDGKSVVVTKDGKEVKMSAADVSGKIRAADVKVKQGDKLEEGKSTVDAWAAAMIKASGIKIPAGPATSDTGDGYWISSKQFDKLIAGLKAAGYKHSAARSAHVYDLKSKKRGMSFDFDDPNDKDMVGIRFFDEGM